MRCRLGEWLIWDACPRWNCDRDREGGHVIEPLGWGTLIGLSISFSRMFPYSYREVPTCWYSILLFSNAQIFITGITSPIWGRPKTRRVYVYLFMRGPERDSLYVYANPPCFFSMLLLHANRKIIRPLWPRRRLGPVYIASYVNTGEYINRSPLLCSSYTPYHLNDPYDFLYRP